MAPKVALLATGNELTDGDVLETNSFYMSQRLKDQDIRPGMHLTVSDDQVDLEQAMSFLLQAHEVLIISGGLGPTSDDRTRFAVGAILQQELYFDQACWEQIIERFQNLSLAIPENNRLQCLFPKGAKIFPNINGTAAGCQISTADKQIFMLPGPPFECLPIFEQYVLPFLNKNNYSRPPFRQEWLLLNVSEGGLANQLDPLIENSLCEIGYRVNYPYLELKLRCLDQANLSTMVEKIQPIIETMVVSTQKQKASMQLIQYVKDKKFHFHIDDKVTGGLMSTILVNPDTYPYLNFNNQSENNSTIHICLEGLENYWHNKKIPSQLEILIQNDKKQNHFSQTVPYRGERTLTYVVETACWIILKAIR